jgi:anti-anti-sigma regulatory factor
LALGAIWRSVFAEDDHDLTVSLEDGQTIVLAGHALECHVAKAIAAFRAAIDHGNLLAVDISGLKAIDQRFFGLLLMARKQMIARGGRLQISGASARIRRAFRFNRFGFLLNPSTATETQHNWGAPEMVFAQPEIAMEVSSAPGKP